MDLYPEDFKEQLDEALEFAKYLKEKGIQAMFAQIVKDLKKFGVEFDVFSSENKIRQDGKVEEVIDLGKRKLAYEIKKNKEAYYVQINFESKPEAIAELERIYRITDGILKFITVRK